VPRRLVLGGPAAEAVANSPLVDVAGKLFWAADHA